MKSSYSKKLFQLVIITSILRLLAASFSELGNDEVYYWTYACRLQWNYFDHPPMVALWIKAFTANLVLEKFELFIRLGSIFSCAISSIILFNLVKKIHSEQAGWFTACLYNACFYASIMTGVFILPDSPQMIFWCGSLYILVKILDKPGNWFYWLSLGICIGLSIMSKVHGIFLWFGFGMFILMKRSQFFKMPQLYFSGILTLIIISPILFWNISNNFITFRFHGERAVSSLLTFNLFGITREIYGQILYTNPINIVIIISALVMWRRQKLKHISSIVLFNFIAIPMICVFLVISFLGDTLPHWSGPAYVTLLPIAGIFLSEKYPLLILPRPLLWSLSLMTFVLVSGIIVINLYPGAIGKYNDRELGSKDFSLDMFGWRQGGEKFRQIYLQDQKEGRMPVGSPVACYNWYPAAHEDYYFCRPINIKLIGLGPEYNLHHYIWLNSYNLPEVNMQKAYSIVPSNENYNARNVYMNYYNQVDSVAIINSYRNGKICRYFTIFRMQGWKGTVSIANNKIISPARLL